MLNITTNHAITYTSQLVDKNKIEQKEVQKKKMINIAKTTKLTEPPKGHHKRMTTADLIQDFNSNFFFCFQSGMV